MCMTCQLNKQTNIFPQFWIKGLGSLPGNGWHFGITLPQNLWHFGICLPGNWQHFGIALPGNWWHFGIAFLENIALPGNWRHFDITLPGNWQHFGITLPGNWQHLGITLPGNWWHLGGSLCLGIDDIQLMFMIGPPEDLICGKVLENKSLVFMWLTHSWSVLFITWHKLWSHLVKPWSYQDTQIWSQQVSYFEPTLFTHSTNSTVHVWTCVNYSNDCAIKTLLNSTSAWHSGISVVPVCNMWSTPMWTNVIKETTLSLNYCIIKLNFVNCTSIVIIYVSIYLSWVRVHF